MYKTVQTLLFLTLFFVFPAMAFDHDTPAEVAIFIMAGDIKEHLFLYAVKEDPEFSEKTWELLSENEKLELGIRFAEQVGSGTELNISAVKDGLLLIDRLPELMATVVANKKFYRNVPMSSRHLLPPEYRKTEFDTITPFNFDGPLTKILAIGGTSKELKLLEEKYGLDAQTMCAINVLPISKPHYLADMSNEEHMANFVDRFDLAFMHAVPLSEHLLNDSFKNISKTLTENGLFFGFSTVLKSEQDAAKLLLQNGFAFAKTLFQIKNDVAFFVASKSAVDSLEEAIANNKEAAALYAYVTSDLEAQRKMAESKIQ